MFSVSTFLSKTTARLVLAAYLTQIFAPLVHAMETLTISDPSRGTNPLESWQETSYASPKQASSCRQEAMGPEPHPDPVGQTFGRQDFTEADYAALYQYCVEVQAVGESVATL